jgi:cell division protein FtsL
MTTMVMVVVVVMMMTTMVMMIITVHMIQCWTCRNKYLTRELKQSIHWRNLHLDLTNCLGWTSDVLNCAVLKRVKCFLKNLDGSQTSNNLHFTHHCTCIWMATPVFGNGRSAMEEQTSSVVFFPFKYS